MRVSRLVSRAASSMPTTELRLTSVLPSAMHAIHGTPAVLLSRLTAELGIGDGKIVAKLEYLSPGFSKKDRIARQMVEEALASGSLRAGQPVLELTSGNTGTGLAITCACLGHPFVAVMSRGNSPERARMMRALGAEVILVDQCTDSAPGQVSGDDLARVFEVAERVVAERGAFRADQFELLGNFRAHHEHTGPELLRQAEGSGLSIDAWVDFVGSGGTYAGVTAALREARGEAVRCFVVEPEGSAVLAAAASGASEKGEASASAPHKIQGGGYSMARLTQLATSMPPDGYLTVSSEVALQTSRDLARLEGIFAGFSGGANVAAAVELLRGPHRGGTVACVICDSGLKYLSTDLWE